jgi:TatD DNase family protein
MFQGQYHGRTVHSPDLRAVLQRAIENGVSRIMVTAGSLSEVKEATKLVSEMAVEFPGMLATTVGVHPTRVSEFEQYEQGPDVYLQELRNLALRHAELNIVAIGEMGLGMSSCC